MQPSKKQEKARTRNWQKARVKSFCLDRSVLVLEERIIFDKIIELRDELLIHWDLNTVIVNNFFKND